MTAVRKPRTKSPTLHVPQSKDEANALIKAFGDHLNAITEIGTDLQRQSAALKDTAEAAAAPHKEALKLLEKQLQAFAEARRDELTQNGKTKTIELPAGHLVWRNDPPSVKVAGKVSEVVAWLLDQATPAIRKLFLRVKPELDKESMLKHAAEAAKVPGVSIIADVEKFAIIPAGLELAEED
ncbi:hypothetical protein sos41_31560 [Alphaproteobacteria bacterium SO-S41]|nr:hypothetical protein sos41_31560 [Alphaproteobacteria bacterium SO-S41]